MGVFTVIAVDHRLVQVLPASFLFMVSVEPPFAHLSSLWQPAAQLARRLDCLSAFAPVRLVPWFISCALFLSLLPLKTRATTLNTSTKTYTANLTLDALRVCLHKCTRCLLCVAGYCLDRIHIQRILRRAPTLGRLLASACAIVRAQGREGIRGRGERQ